MSRQNRTTLKNYFRTGQKPTQGQFADLIDSGLNLTDDGLFDVGGNLGLGHDNPASRLSVNGNLSVSPNNDNAPNNGLFVHGNVGIGAGFTSPAAQLAVKGSVYIGNTENTDPGANSLKVDGNIETEGNLSTRGHANITGTLHAMDDTTIDGNLTLADTKHVAADEVRALDSGGLKLYEDGGKGLLVHDGSGDVSVDGNLTLADAKHVAADEVRARDVSGLRLLDASGTGGLVIHDTGNVSIGDVGDETNKLFVQGNLRVLGHIETSTLSVTGQTHQTDFKGAHGGEQYVEYTIDVPDNKVVVGLLARRYRQDDEDFYTFALKYK